MLTDRISPVYEGLRLRRLRRRPSYATHAGRLFVTESLVRYRFWHRVKTQEHETELSTFSVDNSVDKLKIKPLTMHFLSVFVRSFRFCSIRLVL